MCYVQETFKIHYYMFEYSYVLSVKNTFYFQFVLNHWFWSIINIETITRVVSSGCEWDRPCLAWCESGMKAEAWAKPVLMLLLDNLWSSTNNTASLIQCYKVTREAEQIDRHGVFFRDLHYSFITVQFWVRITGCKAKELWHRYNKVSWTF